MRLFSASRSPSAQEGWYVVYLFAGKGSAVYLSLNQGTTTWTKGDFQTRPHSELRAQATYARGLVAQRIAQRPDLQSAIDLEAPGNRLPEGYEAEDVVAFRYDRGAVPPMTRRHRASRHPRLSTRRQRRLPGQSASPRTAATTFPR